MANIAPQVTFSEGLLSLYTPHNHLVGNVAAAEAALPRLKDFSDDILASETKRGFYFEALLSEEVASRSDRDIGVFVEALKQLLPKSGQRTWDEKDRVLELARLEDPDRANIAIIVSKYFNKWVNFKGGLSADIVAECVGAMALPYTMAKGAGAEAAKSYREGGVYEYGAGKSFKVVSKEETFDFVNMEGDGKHREINWWAVGLSLPGNAMWRIPKEPQPALIEPLSQRLFEVRSSGMQNPRQTLGLMLGAASLAQSAVTDIPRGALF